MMPSRLETFSRKCQLEIYLTSELLCLRNTGTHASKAKTNWLLLEFEKQLLKMDIFRTREEKLILFWFLRRTRKMWILKYPRLVFSLRNLSHQVLQD